MKIDKNWTNVVPTKASRVGGTRKVRDLDADETCTDPSHNPPGMMVYEDGHYEHTCPGCGHVTSFVVRKPRWRVEKSRWIEDGCGNTWEKCERENCALEIVRPGKVQCDTCESMPDEPAPTEPELSKVCPNCQKPEKEPHFAGNLTDDGGWYFCPGRGPVAVLDRLPAPPEPAAREMPEAVKTEAERGLEEVYRFNDGRSLRRNGVVFGEHGRFTYRDVLSKADTRELIQHFERNLAQPVAVGMTEELDAVLEYLEEHCERIENVVYSYDNAKSEAHHARACIAAVRKKVRQQAAQERKVELPKVREFFDQFCKLPQYHNEQGRDFLEGIYAELDAAEGKGEGRG